MRLVSESITWYIKPSIWYVFNFWFRLHLDIFREYSKLAGPVLTGTHFYILIFSVLPLLTCWQYFATQELKHQHLGY